MFFVSVKALDIIRQFDGQGDFSEWIKKVELVVTLQKIDALEKFSLVKLSPCTTRWRRR